jgi:hypothetical protein
MKRIGIVLTVALVLALASPSLAASIHLKNRTIEGSDAVVPWAVLNEHAGRHVLVQLAFTPTADEREDLAARGVHLLTAIPPRAYLAFVEPKNYASVKADSPFRLVTALLPEDKLHPRIVSGAIDDFAIGDDGAVLFVVKFHPDVTPAEGAAQMDEAGGTVLRYYESLDLAYVTVPAPEDAYWLAEQDAVQYVALPEPAWGLFNDKMRAVVKAELAHDAPYDVTGQGVPVLVYDGGIVAHKQNGDAVHPDLAGRLETTAGIPDIIGHANHVSCTVAGDGTKSNGKYAGVAPEAQIVSMDFTQTMMGYPFVANAGDMDDSYRRAMNEFGVRTANNSIGANLGPNNANCEWMGDYTVASALIDEIVGGKNGRTMIIVWAAGNEVTSGCPGTFYTTPPPSPAKNTIAVGATSSLDEEIAFFSSRGPTDDGRLRPDVTAPGHEKDGGLMMLGTRSCVAYAGIPSYMDMSGTSQACPVVTGATALALELWDREIGDGDMPPALMKALVIHGATELGKKGPDYTYGYGGLRIPASLDLLLDRTFETVSVEQGDEYEEYFTHAGKGAVKVTLVWTDPVPALSAEKDLVNNLDLVVVGPDGTIYYPWVLDPERPEMGASPGVDSLNPVEQVSIDDAPAGDYIVRVTGTNVPEGPQSASYVYTGLTLDPNGGDDDDTPDDDDNDDQTDDDNDHAGDDDDDDNGCGS